MNKVFTLSALAAGLTLLVGPAFASVTVPEPTSLALVGAGAMAIAAVAVLRRRK